MAAKGEEEPASAFQIGLLQKGSTSSTATYCTLHFYATVSSIQFLPRRPTVLTYNVYNRTSNFLVKIVALHIEKMVFFFSFGNKTASNGKPRTGDQVDSFSATSSFKIRQEDGLAESSEVSRIAATDLLRNVEAVARGRRRSGMRFGITRCCSQRSELEPIIHLHRSPTSQNLARMLARR